MSVLRKEQEDQSLSTADIVNADRNHANAPLTPRQAYANEPQRNDPMDYTPPPDVTAGRGPLSVQIPPATQAAAIPLPANNTPGPVVVANGARDAGQPGPLFPDDELHNFRARWDQVQASFVDEPRKAVEQADSLVANVVKRIAEQFACERENLEKQWDRGDDVNTEDLRQALKRYRGFFDRLLTF